MLSRTNRAACDTDRRRARIRTGFAGPTGVGALLLLICMMAPFSVMARAGTPPAGTSPAGTEVFSDFLACDGIARPAERLVCYDAALKKYKIRFGLLRGTPEEPARDRGSAGAAAGSGGALASRGPLAESWRTAPGYGEEAPKRIEGVIVSARTDAAGHWIFRLDNGQVWKASDGTWLRHRDYEGKEVVLKRGWMGGWRLKIKEYKEVGRFKRIR